MVYEERRHGQPARGEPAGQRAPRVGRRVVHPDVVEDGRLHLPADAHECLIQLDRRRKVPRVRKEVA